MSTTLDWVRELIPEAQAWQHEMVAANIDGLYAKYYDTNDDLYQAKRHIESLRAQVEALRTGLENIKSHMRYVHGDLVYSTPVFSMADKALDALREGEW